MTRRMSVGSIHFKLKFRPDERRVDVRQKGRELFSNIKEASVRRGRRTDDRAELDVSTTVQVYFGLDDYGYNIIPGYNIIFAMVPPNAIDNVWAALRLLHKSAVR